MKRKNLTIVLDIDETLVHTLDGLGEFKSLKMNDKEIMPQNSSPLGYSIVANSERMVGLYRPGLFNFLRRISQIFDNVIIWSAGTGVYVESIVRCIYRNIPDVKYPLLVLTRNNCSYDGVSYHKPLARIGKIISDNNFDISFDMKRTLILDDRAVSFSDNPKNGILIPPYEPVIERGQFLNQSDDNLLSFVKWCESINISELDNVTLSNLPRRDVIFGKAQES